MLIQCGALPLTLAILYVMASVRLPTDYLTLAVVQGLIAALLTWKLALAAWWRAIQLLFPLAVLTALALQLPSWLFGAGFLLLLGWYWSTFRTQVPYYPSGPAVWDAVRQLLPAEPGAAPRVIDIGSGLGGLTLYLSRVRPDAEVTGIELAPLPWLYSWLRAKLGRSRARFLRGDYEHLDFSQFDLVFAYLSPAAMPGLWRKARAEMRPNSMLVSYEFVIEERAADSIIRVTEREIPLHIWYF
ncbi:methyltransferase domain-containing protein [Duganella sp. FT94W]|uniref:Methyltransferase domain-containing protein n=1 Tax=Duganella lactea TaxID=2692173 RepID=A0ABW9VBV0_9BURK|nr:class I SAM-dependent methyltransferase [Duganella lactea]MYM36387.1 methyltransferase domain-containing protein [Duganella lactea]